MEYRESGAGAWGRLSAIKQNLLTRAERYAQLTIPKVCLPEGQTPETMDETHDYQALGAQAVNNVVNKLMIAMFAPSRPFFRVAEGKTTKRQAAEQGISETDLNNILAGMERDAAKQLDAKGQRPKLYQACRHLVVTGNCLMIIAKDSIRILGLRYYCVKRTHDGKIHTLVIREKMRFDELDYDIQELWQTKYRKDNEVSHYKLICRTPQGGYYMTQWIDEQRLPAKYDGRWSDEKKLPYRALTWDLADESDYGTGLCEEYAGDLESLSVLSEAIVTGAVVSTEFRWTVNPNGVTSVDDMRDSKNGDTIGGSSKDVGAITPGVTEGVKIAQAVSQEYIQRISRGFLMGSAITRDAERVTAEEVRMQTAELQSSFGGTYSALAPSLQEPIAIWMLASADRTVAGTDLSIVIVTGLDALSRNGDLENLRMAMQDLSMFAQAPEPLMQRVKWNDLASYVGQGRGVDLARFIMNDQEWAQVQQQIAAQQQAQEVATAGGVAQAEAAAQPTQE